MFGIERKRNRKRVLALIDRLSEKLTGDEVAQAKELITNHDQPETAVNFISNMLYNNQLEISQEDYTEIQTVCNKLQLSSTCWEMLGPIVRD